MERSLAARLPLARRQQRSRRRERAARRAFGLRDRLLVWLERLCSRRRTRVALGCALLALPALGGGWMWLRSSSLVAVRSVQLSGVHGAQRPAIEAALTAAARRMTTLAVNPAALQAAVAAYPVVASIRVSPRLPHGLRIRVVERPPVAVLEAGGTRTAVAADGVVLGAALLSRSLPTIDVSSAPRTAARVRASDALAELAVIHAAPRAFAAHVASLSWGARGLTVAMRNGLLVYFGDSSEVHAKWLSLTRVLADPSSAGASYVDVRLPERPAAGFAGGVAPDLQSAAQSSGETGAASSSSSEATIQALAESLRGPQDESAQTSSTSAPAGGEAAVQQASTPVPSGEAPAEAPAP